ncbi:replicative DNA helicase [Massilia sp. YIM B02769]|uniref:replicative DNA helicase n=1 Tax=Massilia sp. YIM B02769 TaxID=3050129 RepID=UPI0025B651D9|nr:replicative DNA helicase [Massilia sp. YIM B02769]MDN4061284.1 replicative DNA helicase [Massilia sp. YIM B02769]
MSNMADHNPIPQSIEAEQAVLGALLRVNDAVDKLGDLQAKHFTRDDHRAIYTEILALIKQGHAADPVTVWAALQARGGPFLDGLGGYLIKLSQSVPSAANVSRYVSIVVDRALLRGVMHVADSINGLAQNTKGKSADEILDAMQTMVTSLAERRVRNEPRMIRDVLQGVLEQIEKRSEGESGAMPTGIAPIDRLFNGGLRPGQLIIVAGRPSMGKTALTSDIGLNMAADVSVLNFSMEMESQEIAARALSNRGRVPLASILGDMSGAEDWPGVTTGCIKLDSLRFAIDDTPAISLLDLRMKAKAWKRRHGLDVIIVDYLGLMSGGEGEKRHEQIGSYSRGLKALAKELGVAIIALAQLNRAVEGRPDKRPMLSDLRDSGEIEQDADIVMLVHRPEMYEPENAELRGFAEVLVRKQRSGALGDIQLRFDGPTCRFEPWGGCAPPPAPSRGRGSPRFEQ